MGFDFPEKLNIDPAIKNIGWNLRIPAFVAMKNRTLFKETLNNCHFERSEKSIVLITKDSSLCSE